MRHGRLRSDGTLFFEEADLFLQHVEEVLRSGGILVQTDDPPPLRQPASYTLAVAGVESRVLLRAEAVFAGNGLVGFEILDLEQIQSAVGLLRAAAEASRAAAPPPAEIARPTEFVLEELDLESDDDEAVETVEIGSPELFVPELQVASPQQVVPPPARAAPKVEHTGELVPFLSVDQVVTSAGRQAMLESGAPLAATQVLLAAGLMPGQRTLEIEGWTLSLVRRQIVACAAPDGDTGLNYLGKQRPTRQVVSSLVELARERHTTSEHVALSQHVLDPKLITRGLYQLMIDRAGELARLNAGRYRVRGGLTTTPAVAIPFDPVGREMVRRSLHCLPPGAPTDYFIERERMSIRLAPNATPLIRQFARAHQRYERWLLRLDGMLPLREMLRQAPMAKETAYELLSALLALELCSLVRPGEQAIPDPEEVLGDWLSRIERKPPFVVLGLHWIVAPEEIQPRIVDRRQELGPKGELASASTEAAELARRILELSEEAYRVLRDPQQRSRARRKMASEGELITARDVLQKKAAIARLRSQPDEVRRLSEILSELGPAEALVEK